MEKYHDLQFTESSFYRAYPLALRTEDNNKAQSQELKKNTQ